ncbi:magnesium/cobalt transporter CorA [Sporolactobacillus shoreae]|uniref:Magnesium transport protein CorA n=1 Tax=Sporolactobacillus shoreae TaxID=1465501 RepID=A0A4Z0GLL9_9BACL|nr:magnesium/cobalt transporter CorA [Sporolactobacillus shoreae]TGA97063.1 magnesium/cobalt transporter CorA [Sporolactobacillus shoreae]
MIRILAKSVAGEMTDTMTLSSLNTEATKWHWVDINEPNDAENDAFSHHFPFFRAHVKNDHRYTKRPQLKLFDDYYFLSIQAVSPSTLKPHELQMYIGKNYFFSLHIDNLKAVNDVWHECRSDENISEEETPKEILHRLLDRLVEQYFMVANLLEDKIDALDLNSKHESIHKLNDRVFQIRSELLSFRRAVTPLQDIFQRMVGSTYVPTSDADNIYLRNISENLARLTHMIESNMEITSDIRDSYLSLTSYRTNSIMQTLTVITTIFMPLTFIAGIYGMNFKYMPELNWHAGYFLVLGLMMGIAISMYFWFRKKGWFDK